MSTGVSVLTRILHDSCGLNSRTVLIATVSALEKNVKATLHTLALAQLATKIQDRPEFNKPFRACTRPSLRPAQPKWTQSSSLLHRFKRIDMVMLPVMN